MSEPQDPRDAASAAGMAVDADPPTEVVSDPANVAAEPDAAPEPVGPEEPHDADPPTEVVEQADGAQPEAVEPADAEWSARPADIGDEATGETAGGAADGAVEVTDGAAEVTGEASDAAAGVTAEAAEITGETAEVIGESSDETAAEAAEAVDGATGEPADDTTDEAFDEAADEVLGEEIESDELPELADDELEKALEALLLVVDSPVEEDVLAAAVGTGVARVTEVVTRMAGELSEQERGLDLRRAGGGWRFYTRDKYAPYVEKMLLDGQRAKLTRAALETLAVIAYRQPVTRARVAAVRGVNCDGVIRTLLARGLVEETGTDLETGGFLYRTTELFLERLGLSSLDDLPPIAPLLPEVDSIDDV